MPADRTFRILDARVTLRWSPRWNTWFVDVDGSSVGFAKDERAAEIVAADWISGQRRRAAR
jgi:hypothetical protein